MANIRGNNKTGSSCQTIELTGGSCQLTLNLSAEAFASFNYRFYFCSCFCFCSCYFVLVLVVDMLVNWSLADCIDCWHTLPFTPFCLSLHHPFTFGFGQTLFNILQLGIKSKCRKLICPKTQIQYYSM